MTTTVPTLTCPFCEASVEPSIPPQTSNRETLRGTETDCERCHGTFAIYYY